MPERGWHRRVAPRGALWALLLVPVGLSSVAWSELWYVPVPAAAALVFNVLRSTADVRVDASGLTVRALVGSRLVHVRAADVLRAGSVPHVAQVKDYWSHGWRISPGQTRVAVRPGEALVVERRDESSVVIAVKDAAGAAAALMAAAATARDTHVR